MVARQVFISSLFLGGPRLNLEMVEKCVTVVLGFKTKTGPEIEPDNPLFKT
jgi:hypothetical protein